MLDNTFLIMINYYKMNNVYYYRCLFNLGYTLKLTKKKSNYKVEYYIHFNKVNNYTNN